MCSPVPPPPAALVNAFLREIQQGHLPDVPHLLGLHPCSPNQPPLTLDALLNSSNKHGDTPFLVAARAGHTSLLEEMHRQHGVPLEHGNFDGKTALHEAAQNGQDQSIQYLVRRGAKVDPLKKADWWVCRWVWSPSL